MPGTAGAGGRQAACPARPGPQVPARGEAPLEPVKKLLTGSSSCLGSGCWARPASPSRESGGSGTEPSRVLRELRAAAVGAEPPGVAGDVQVRGIQHGVEPLVRE